MLGSLLRPAGAALLGALLACAPLPLTSAGLEASAPPPRGVVAPSFSKFAPDEVHYAIADRNKAELRIALERAPEAIHTHRINGVTPLMFAISPERLRRFTSVQPWPEGLRILLEAGADPNEPGTTPPLVAALRDNWQDPALAAELASALLEYGADPDAADEHGFRPFDIATLHGASAAVELLRDAGGSPSSVDLGRVVELHAAVKGDDIEATKQVLALGSELTTALGIAGAQAIHYARSVAMAKLLVAHGADVNVPTHDSWVPLSMAVQVEPAALVEYLVSAGASGAGAGGNYAPLLNLTWQPDIDERKLAALLSGGADLSATWDDGTTALMLAVGSPSNLGAVRRLLDAGALVDAVNDNGETAFDRASSDAMKALLRQRGGHPGTEVTSSFLTAVRNGDRDTVSALVDKHPRLVHAGTKDGSLTRTRGALIHALEHGHAALADLLLSRGARLDDLVVGRESPIVWAARAGNLQAIVFLASRGADLDHPLETTPPLEVAIRAGQAAAVTALLEAGASPNVMRSSGDRPIHAFAMLGATRTPTDVGVRIHDDPVERIATQLGALDALLKSPDVLVNAPTQTGGPPLVTGAAFAHTAILTRLVADPRIDLDARDREGETALFRATWVDRPAVVKLMLEAGASHDIKSAAGTLPMAAIRSAEVAGLFSAHTTLLAARSPDGMTPLHRVVSVEAAEQFLAAGADVNATDNNGNTPLHSAIERLRFLSVYHDYQSTQVTENQVVRFATSSGDPLYDLALWLISHNADLTARNRQGVTPLATRAPGGQTLLLAAARKRDKNVIRFLLEKGAIINARDDDGATPLSVLVHQYGEHAWAKELADKFANQYDYQDWHVRAGRTQYVDKLDLAGGILYISTLRLDDGAKLERARRWKLPGGEVVDMGDTPNISMRVRRLIAGANTVIDFRGEPGLPGQPGQHGDRATGAGADGKNGQVGHPGEVGGTGADFVLNVRVEKIDDLRIMLRGGDGGRGGPGGDGGPGGPVDNGRFIFNRGTGGDGGNGGPGGDGGFGGSLNLVWRSALPGDTGELPKGLTVDLNGGAPGPGGAPGGAAAGKNWPLRTPPKVSEPGQPGPPGEPGRPGKLTAERNITTPDED